MTLGGRRVAVRRPRIRSADETREVPVETYEYFADRDPLTRAVMDRMLAGVSARRFAQVGEPVGEGVEQSSSTTSKSSVSEMFVERTTTALEELTSRRPRYHLIVKRGSPPKCHDDPDILGACSAWPFPRCRAKQDRLGPRQNARSTRNAGVDRSRLAPRESRPSR